MRRHCAELSAYLFLFRGIDAVWICDDALPPSNPFAQFPYVARPVGPRVLPLTDTPLGGMVTEPLASAEPDGQKRRSTRIVQAVPITVTGVDALGQPFKERTTTVMVNCHGCKYQSKHYVPKNSMVTLEVPRPEAGQKRTTQGRVVWVQRPRTVRELFQIGLEFEVAGNVWGIAFPPEDWVTSLEDAGAKSSAPYAWSDPALAITTADAVTAPEPPALVADKKTEAPAAVQQVPAHVDVVATPSVPAPPLSAPAPSASTAPPPKAPTAPAPQAPARPVSAPAAPASSASTAAPKTPTAPAAPTPTSAVPQAPAPPTHASVPAAPAGEGKIHVVPSAGQDLQGPL